MSVNISASALMDYLVCKQRVKFRINVPEQGIQTSAMLAGTIAHGVIEEFWNNKEAADLKTIELLENSFLDNAMKARVFNSVDNFFKYFSQLVSEGDLIEKKFRIKLEKDAFLVGKFDRVSKGNIFDWKTSARYPKTINNNIQFVFYDECYKRLYGKSPISVYYAHLPTGKLIRYNRNEILCNYLFGEVVPAMISDVKAGNFFRAGLYSYNDVCKDCSFKDYCFRELGYDVMDSSEHNS